MRYTKKQASYLKRRNRRTASQLRLVVQVVKRVLPKEYSDSVVAASLVKGNKARMDATLLALLASGKAVRTVVAHVALCAADGIVSTVTTKATRAATKQMKETAKLFGAHADDKREKNVWHLYRIRAAIRCLADHYHRKPPNRLDAFVETLSYIIDSITRKARSMAITPEKGDLR